MFKIHKLYTNVYVSFTILSLFVTAKIIYYTNKFNHLNTPVFDGVIYNYQQITRFSNFNNNFSFINRLNQAYYEYTGNYVTGLYNALLCVLSPAFLVNDLDLYIRTFFSIFIFSLSIYIYLKDYFPKRVLIIAIIIITQFPLFYHFRVGLGTYIPETPAVLFLISGYLIFIKFLEQESRKLFFIAITLLVIPTFIRFNFIVNTILIIIPLIIFFIVQFKKFKYKITYLISILLVLIIFIIHFGICFDKFYAYYTKIAYFYGTYSSSFTYLLVDLKDIFGVESFLILLLTSLILSKYRTKSINIKTLLLSLYPFILYFSFIFIYLKSTSVPHIVVVLVIFLIICIMMTLQYFIKLKLNVNNEKIIILFAIIFVCQNFKYMQDYYHLKTLDENKSCIEIAKIIRKEKNLKSLKYISLLDAMQEVRINTLIHKESNVLLNNKTFFYTHDIYFKNLINCKNKDECTDYFINNLKQEKYDFIFINKSDNKIYNKLSLAVNKNLREFMLENQNYKLNSTFNNRYHGKINCYKLK